MRLNLRSGSFLRLVAACFAVALLATVPSRGQDDATAETADAAVAPAERDDSVEGVAEEWEEDPSKGVRILRGNVRIERLDKTGHVYADTVTMHYDPDGDSRKIDNMLAEGNVNLREGDIYATCDQADFTEGTAVIDMTGNVVVLQTDGRMEADRFKYDRRTGKRQGWGGVRFRFELPREEEAPAEGTDEEATDTTTETGDDGGSEDG